MKLIETKNIYSTISFVLIVLFAFSSTFHFINWGAQNHPFNNDVDQYYCYLINLSNNHSLNFVPDYHQYWLIETPTLHYVPKVTYGMAFFYAPFFLFAKLISSNQSSGYEPAFAWCIHLGCMFYTLIGFWITRKTLLIFFKDKIVAVTLLTLFFATNLFYYTVSESLIVHGVLFFLLSIFIYNVIQWQKTLKRKNLFSFMFVAGFITLIRPSEIIVLLIPLLIGVYNVDTFKLKVGTVFSNIKSILFSGLLFLLPIIPQLIFWKIKSGSFLFFSYGSNERFFWSDPQIWNVFFSFRKGLFIYSPVLVFFFVGFIFLFRKNKTIFYPFIVYFILNIYLISCWWDWSYGGSFGMRALIHCYALLTIPFGYFVSWMFDTINSTKIKNGVISFFTLSLVCFSIVNLFQSNLYKHRILHFDGMTYQAYKFTFLKRTYTPLELEELQLMFSPTNYEARRNGKRDE